MTKGPTGPPSPPIPWAEGQLPMGFVTSAQKHDVVSVGDVAMDVFIHLPEAGVRQVVDDSGRWLVLPLGTKLACEQGSIVASGGDAANAAVAFARLGLRVGLASFLAHDQYGRDLLVALHGEGVQTNLVHVDDPAETNRNFVLWSGSDRTILVRHQPFNYHWPTWRPSDVPAWLYLTSVGSNSLKYEDDITDWLEANPSVRLAFRPGTHQLEAGAHRLARLIERSELLVVTEEDAVALLDAPGSDLVADILALGPRRLVLTRRDGGADAADAAQRYDVPPYPDTSPIYERTGAGDAFAATVAAGLIAGLSFDDALRRAPVNAMSVTHELGAQTGLLREDELDAYLAEAPDEFTVHVAPSGASRAQAD
jgi:sugar/nucleoside kinase (ribokinase family)